VVEPDTAHAHMCSALT